MLNALELVGFKSFADKTRFEFPPGITVVVGPNGSGKSNVVDAIKWVLGEQSVKSLRGSEMADVIFNGSGGRHALHAAEATLAFDNAGGLLPLDTAEVTITRRVYRNGEGEYLINRQPSRLRDIRDLFSGTGVTGEAYSIIEQGKVDVLLQASARDRRVIFEEAAGISRFKSKKLESLRRLERVEQNLLRLADIVEEVEGRLRSVRLQASKARRYKECAGRLQDLRTQVGLADWRRLSEALAAHEAWIDELRSASAGISAQVEADEIRLVVADSELADAVEAIREGEARLAENRQEIARHESTIEHERSRCRELDEETARQRSQLAVLKQRSGGLEQELGETAAAVAVAEAQHREVGARLSAGERGLAELTARLRHLRQENEQRRSAYLEQMRQNVALDGEISSLESRQAAADDARERTERRAAELELTRGKLAGQLHALRQELADALQDLETREAELSAVHQRLSRLRQDQVDRRGQLADWRQRLSGATERAALLEELEARFEGLGAGVKEVMRLVRSDAPDPFAQVLGLVAELFQVRIENAPLIEVALGEAAAHVVVGPGEELWESLVRDAYRFQGRVGFVPLESIQPPPDRVGLEDVPGVLGRADGFVEAPPQCAALVRGLLSRTWIVADLAIARRLAAGPGRGQNFVTLAGERLAAEGTLSVGPRLGATGLISRRSELRVLRQQMAEWEERVARAQGEIAAAETAIGEEERRVQRHAAERQHFADAAVERRLRLQADEERASQVAEQQAAVSAELTTATRERDEAERRLVDVCARRAAAESQLAALEAAGVETARQLDELEQSRQQHIRAATAAQIEQAKSEERLENLSARLRQFEHDQIERRHGLTDAQGQLAQAEQRQRQAEGAILRAGSAIAELYLRKEEVARRNVACVNRREELREERQRLSAACQQARAQLRKLEESLHCEERSAGEVRLERGSLASRLRDDYGIELAELEHEPSAEEERQRAEVDSEIADLRRKINAMGAVNLDALAELDDLERRHGTLSAQYQDLASAKASLEQIIGRINADSRRLFEDTFESVRGHFQTLFRKLFGGGQADLLLDEGVDVLESGVEIVARPPGKELRSISLMSGGEKTLTCVALLLAIFRSRPSPFCVLDEVDAALDEANIERFVGVLKEFLVSTQFIVVTHSKKTMTCASTLYGVTMQESGISKRVSVRFEDVSDNGEIVIASPDAASSEDADEQAA